MEELHHVGGERSSSRDADAEAPPQPLSHLGEHQPIGQPLLQGESAVHGNALSACAAGAGTDPERPQADPPAQAARTLDLAERVRVDLLVHAGHGRQDRRPHRRESLRHARDVGSERDRSSAMRRRLVGEPAVAVGERQEEEHGVARLVHSLHDADRRVDEVAMREHAAFGRPSCARRVDQRREVLFGDRLRLQVPR